MLYNSLTEGKMTDESLNRPKRATNAFDAHKTTFTGETLTATKLKIPLVDFLLFC